MIVLEYAGMPYLMTVKDDKLVPVHRAIMEEQIGRPLEKDEVVHHLDEDKRNNDPSNLQVMSKREHAHLHAQERWANKRKGHGYCAICERPLGRCLSVCMSCRSEWGLNDTPYVDWPEWVKVCVRTRKRETYRGRIEGNKTVSLEQMEEDGWRFVHGGGLAAPTNCRPVMREETLMAYAPYEDEAANAQYRQACGIAERGE